MSSKVRVLVTKLSGTSSDTAWRYENSTWPGPGCFGEVAETVRKEDLTCTILGRRLETFSCKQA